MAARAPNVFTIAAGAPFLDVLAGALADGTLGGGTLGLGTLGLGTGPPDPLALAAATVYLPTRRAGRALARALHRASGRAVLMPKIAGLGDVGEDEDALAFSPEESEAGHGAVVSDAERHAVLADIAILWSRSTDAWSDRAPVIGPDPVPRTAVEAAAFAIELAGLLDELVVADVSREDLARIVPEELAELARNWKVNLDFLTHAIKQWEAHLNARGLVERVTRRDRRLRAEAARLAREGSPAPVIAAGSTGSVPAAAELMHAIAYLDNGAVLLPGLDRDLDQRGWSEIGPDHPQFGLKRLIGEIGVERDQVRLLGEPPSGPRAVRAQLIGEVMRPAASAELWAGRLAALGAEDLRAALAGLSLIEAGDEHEEARVIALMLRRAADQPERFTALVTPDRTLARRVSSELARFGMTVDDSAGQPLAQTVPGVFQRLVAAAAAARFAPVATLALLKHPLTRLGLDVGAVRHAARVSEIAGMRGGRPAAGLAGLAAALARGRAAERRHPVAARLTDAEFAAAGDLLDRLAQAYQPVIRLEHQPGPVGADELISAYVEAAEAIAEPPQGEPPGLWAGPAGEAVAAFFAEAIAAARHAAPLEVADYGGWIEQLMRGRVVRLPAAGPANIAIWGPLEARLQPVDRLILGGLNEGVWPGETETDPWLGRPMRAALGLDAPERRIGLQAHDVAQALHGREVILTRARKSGGTQAVPSRWIWRLRTLLQAAGLPDALEPAEPWSGWARGLDAVEHLIPCAPPKPAPPAAARPKRLSATGIETLLRDPYAIYAREILKLEPLEALDAAPDALDYGTIIHAALGRLIAEFPAAPLPGDALARLIAIGEAEFAALDDRPGLKAFWQLRFERIARWFVAADSATRAPGTVSHGEISGRIELLVPAPGETFTLTARADRIDIDGAGSATIVDYKTGNPPSGRQIKALLAPQLPLEAAILAGGGFGGIEAGGIAELIHLQLSGREPPGETHPVRANPAELAGTALALLTRLVAIYADPAQPYASRVAPLRVEFAGRYDHLARVGEWSLALGRSHGE